MVFCMDLTGMKYQYLFTRNVGHFVHTPYMCNTYAHSYGAFMILSLRWLTLLWMKHRKRTRLCTVWFNGYVHRALYLGCEGCFVGGHIDDEWNSMLIFRFCLLNDAETIVTSFFSKMALRFATFLYCVVYCFAFLSLVTFLYSLLSCLFYLPCKNAII